MKALTDQAMRMGTTYLLLGMKPNYWVFKEMLDSSPGQLAFQSIWVKVDSRPRCPICGDARVDPTRSLGLQQVRTVRHSGRSFTPEFPVLTDYSAPGEAPVLACRTSGCGIKASSRRRQDFAVRGSVSYQVFPWPRQ